MVNFELFSIGGISESVAFGVQVLCDELPESLTEELNLLESTARQRLEME